MYYRLLMAQLPPKKTTLGQLTKHLSQATITILTTKKVDMDQDFLGTQQASKGQCHEIYNFCTFLQKSGSGKLLEKSYETTTVHICKENVLKNTFININLLVKLSIFNTFYQEL